MHHVFLAFSAIALALRFVNPAHVLPSNTPQRKPYENILDSKWVVPRNNRHQNVVPSADYSKGIPISAVWPKPDAEIQCGAKDMTLQIKELGSPVHVNRNESWVSVFQNLPRCSSKKSRHRRMSPPYFGCGFKKDGPGTFPVRVAGTPLVIGCPFPPRNPTVECTTGLQLRLGGVTADKLKIKVMGYWYPLMAICRWCGLSMELQGGELSIKAPFKGICTETKDGVHSISLRSGETEMVFACSPPAPTWPPWLTLPTVFPPPAPKPAIPWHVHPPPAPPVIPWHVHPSPPAPPVIPWHVHPSPPAPPVIPWHVHPSPPAPPVIPWHVHPSPPAPPVIPWHVHPSPPAPPVIPWHVHPSPAPPVIPWHVHPSTPAPLPIAYPITPAPAPLPIGYPITPAPIPWPSFGPAPAAPAPAPVAWPSFPDPNWHAQKPQVKTGQVTYVDKPDGDAGAVNGGCDLNLNSDDNN